MDLNSNKFKAILVDDESESLDVLELVLQQHCPEVEVIKKFTLAKEALMFLTKQKPDIIFLDINMPHISGLDFVNMLSDKNVDIVFTTAYEHYAVKAFKTSAVDYLLKPITGESLRKTVDSIKARHNNDQKTKLQFLNTQLADLKNNSLKKIMLPTMEGMTFIKIREIIYCESQENYSNLYLEDGEKIFATKSLKFLEEILSDYDFQRIHRSFLINMHGIKSFSKTDGGFVVMENNKKIGISRTKKMEFFNSIDKLTKLI